jgi:hypothetical protein
MDAKKLAELGEDLFSKKAPLNTLHQEISDNFYPERADYTVTNRSLGTDFAANLMTSYPIQCRRQLGDQIGQMLRPTAKDWFKPTLRHMDREGTDNEVKEYLQWFGQTQRRAMYDPMAMFKRAMKEGDHDFANIGQCAISIELNREASGLLYRCWHIRDMAWQENEDGSIGAKFRKWKPTIQTLCRLFPKEKLHQQIVEKHDKTPFETVEVMHMVVDEEMYDDDSKGRPRFSIWWDMTHQHMIECTPIWGVHYVIPRWQTVSGSQYSYSPATVAALPDARLLQAMTFTLLEVGEKAAQPPIIATQDVIKSDLGLYAGGVTWVDADYDERLGDALRPLTQDFRGINYGLEMTRDTRLMLESAFFLNKLRMPERAPEMTAYEVGQRVQEYIRNALPLFEPMEDEYNAAVCDASFDILWRHGTFGDPRSWPKKMRGAEIEFVFESPLHDAIEQQKGQKYLEAQTLIGQAIALDPSAAFVPKAETALRDALSGIGVPASWLNSESFVQEAKAAQAKQQQIATALAAMEQGSNVAKNLGASGMVPAAA